MTTRLKDVSAQKDRNEVVATMGDIQEWIDKGEVVGISATLQLKGRRYVQLGSACDNSLEFAGTMLEMAIRRLGFAQREGM